MPLTTAALTLICSTWVDWPGYAGTPELCYAHSEQYHFVYNREGCNVYHYWLERQGHEILRITAIPHKMGECGPDSRDPDAEQKPVDDVEDDSPDDRNDKPRGDNSDANGKGGNKHDRDDFTHGGTETAENKK